MKNIRSIKLTLVMTVFITLLCSGVFVLEAAADSKNIEIALDSGDIKLTLAGLENGEKLNIKAEKKTATPLVLVIPKGTTEIKVGSNPVIIISLRTEREIKIDLSKTTIGEAKVNQAGKTRIFTGSVTIEYNSGSVSTSYQNAELGVKK
jgi:hypothetical protein